MTKQHHGFVHRIAILTLVFSAGWFVMLTELVGARVLAPYFGNSIYVWGSVIAIFLLAMAVGYALGGKLTQRPLTPLAPTALAALAGIYVALTPLIQDHVCMKLYFTGIHAKWAALLAAIGLYALPMALLGGISPYMIQLATKTHGEVGSKAGMLYALSTIGSFVGTLLTAFVLIPAAPLSHILTWSGIVVAAVAVVTALALTDRTAPAAVMALALAALIGVGICERPRESWRSEMKAYQYPPTGHVFSKLSPEELRPEWALIRKAAADEAARYEGRPAKALLSTETPYHHMVVIQDGSVRSLIFGKANFRGAQNEVDLRDIDRQIAEYTHLAFAGLLFGPPPKRVCVIGVGGAVIPRALELTFPGVKVDAIDIDPTVLDVAVEYFFWRPSKNVRVFAQDGRSFLNWVIMNDQPKYDWIILDAYEEDYVPFHLTTFEFIRTVQRALNPGGIVASNLVIDSDLYGCEARVFKRVLGNASSFTGHRSGNILLISQNGREKPLTRKEAGEASMRVRLPADCGIDPRFIMTCFVDGQNWSDNGPILMDLRSPSENLLK